MEASKTEEGSAERMAPYQPPRGRASRGASVDGYRIARRAATYETDSDEFVEQFLAQADTSGGGGFILDL